MLRKPSMHALPFGQGFVKLVELVLEVGHFGLLVAELGAGVDFAGAALLLHHAGRFEIGFHAREVLGGGRATGSIVGGIGFEPRYFLGQHGALLLDAGAGAPGFIGTVRGATDKLRFGLHAEHEDLDTLNSSGGGLEVLAQSADFGEQGFEDRRVGGGRLRGGREGEGEGQNQAMHEAIVIRAS